MKRYFTRLGENYNGPFVDMEEDPYGDWARYEDVEPLEAINRELVEALEIARTSLENDGFGKRFALCLAGKALLNAKGE